MLKTAARLLMFRVLPRRLLPILTVVEVAQLLRAARRQRVRSRGATVVEPSQPVPNDRWRDAFDAHRARGSSPDPRR